MSALPKLRIVDIDVDRTVIVEPTVSEWDVGKNSIKVLFWDDNDWNRIPPMARPKDAQRHAEKGWVLVLPI